MQALITANSELAAQAICVAKISSSSACISQEKSVKTKRGCILIAFTVLFGFSTDKASSLRGCFQYRLNFFLA